MVEFGDYVPGVRPLTPSCFPSRARGATDIVPSRHLDRDHPDMLTPARSSFAFRVFTLLLECLVLFGVPGSALAQPAPRRVPVELHVMSQCPFAIGAEASLAEVSARLGNAVEARLEYIGGVRDDGTLTSMHGPNEVKGDIAQLCAGKLTSRLLEFVACQNRDGDEVASNWEACATELGVDIAALRACIEGEEGRGLLTESFRRSDERGVSGSPTFFIGGRLHEGGRSPQDLGRAVCSEFGSVKPAACVAYPMPRPVHVTLLDDARCADCGGDRLERALRRIVANPVIQRFDYANPEGKRLYRALAPARLPLAVFDVTLDHDPEAAAVLARRIEAKGTFRVLDVGGTWAPVCADPGGCALPECSTTLGCRRAAPRTLEVFVMSHCPYCVRGLAAMKEVLAHFKAAGAPIDFRVHFIGGGDAEGGFDSLHGDEEVAEDLREICAAKHYARDQKFLDYIWCRNERLDDPNWRACASPKTGIDPTVIATCSEGAEGRALLAASFRLGRELGIDASPTWLVNGRHPFSGIHAERIKAEYCRHNAGPGCAASASRRPEVD